MATNSSKSAQNHRRSIALMKFLSGVATRLGVAEHVYVVGGAVRNFVIKQPIKDIDVVIDPIAVGRDDASEWFAEEVARSMPEGVVANLTIKGDWILDGENMDGEVIEIANARKESYGGPGGQGYKPHMTAPSTIEEDIIRREFTFNTLLWRLKDVAEGPDKAEIIDLTGCGLKDLQEGNMRCPRDPDIVFSDDPSRMIRAIKFLLKYGFKIPPEIEASIARNAEKLKAMPSSHLSNMIITEFYEKGTGKAALIEMQKLGLLNVIKEIVRTDKSFREALANWVDRSGTIHFMFDLMDLDMPSGKRLNFLKPEQQARVREITVNMAPQEAERFLQALNQPGKVIDMPKLIADLGVQGREIRTLQQKVQQALLDHPSYLDHPDQWEAAVRPAGSSSQPQDKTADQEDTADTLGDVSFKLGPDPYGAREGYEVTALHPRLGRIGSVSVFELAWPAEHPGGEKPWYELPPGIVSREAIQKALGQNIRVFGVSASWLTRFKGEGLGQAMYRIMLYELARLHPPAVLVPNEAYEGQGKTSPSALRVWNRLNVPHYGPAFWGGGLTSSVYTPPADKRKRGFPPTPGYNRQEENQQWRKEIEATERTPGRPYARDIKAVISELDMLASTLGYEIIELGEIDGDPVNLYKPKDPGDKPKVLVLAGIHGNEPANVFAVLEWFRSGQFTSDVAVSFIPCVNPEGFKHNQREGITDQDPNRQMLPGQDHTPEGQLLRDHQALLMVCGEDGILSLHEDWEERCFYVYTQTEADNRDLDHVAQRLLATGARYFPTHEDGDKAGKGRTLDGILWNVAAHDSSIEEWLGDAGLPVYTTEIPATYDMQQRVACGVDLIRTFGVCAQEQYQDDMIQRVAARTLLASNYFEVGDEVLFGKYKNKRGLIKSIKPDEKGNPVAVIEPIPKGRKQDKEIGLYKFWQADPDKRMKEAVFWDTIKNFGKRLWSALAVDATAVKRIVHGLKALWEGEALPPAERQQFLASVIHETVMYAITNLLLPTGPAGLMIRHAISASLYPMIEKALESKIQSMQRTGSLGDFADFLQWYAYTVEELLHQAIRGLDLAKTARIPLPKDVWVDAPSSEVDEGQGQEIWHLYHVSYGAIGQHIGSVHDLLSEYQMLWVDDTDGDNKINAVLAYKRTKYGNKIAVIASDGTSPAKRAAITKSLGLLKGPGWYAELSGRPAELAETSGVNRLKDDAQVREVLGGKPLTWLGDGFYERQIGAIGSHRKAIFGNPHVSGRKPTDESVSRVALRWAAKLGSQADLDALTSKLFAQTPGLAKWKHVPFIQQDRDKGPEARTIPGPKILVFPKFWSHPEEVQLYMLRHELGHAVSEFYGFERLFKDAQAVGLDLFGGTLPFGQFNSEEAFADAFASYWTGETQRRYPEWASLVDKVVKSPESRQGSCFETAGAASSSQISYAQHLLKQLGQPEPDWSQLDSAAVSALIDSLKKQRGTAVWHGNGQFSHWKTAMTGEEVRALAKDIVQRVREAANPNNFCPVCDEFYVTSCRCLIGERSCPNGHQWVVCPVHGDVIDVTARNTHDGSFPPNSCWCEPSRPCADLDGWLFGIGGMPPDCGHVTCERLFNPLTKVATKTPGQKQDEEAERLVRRPGQKKPPRQDLRRNRVKVDDPDLKKEDQDLSLNYKKIAARWLESKNQVRRPGQAWRNDKGTWSAKNRKNEIRGDFASQEEAKAWAQGKVSPEKKTPSEQEEKAPETEGPKTPKIERNELEEALNKELAKTSPDQGSPAEPPAQSSTPEQPTTEPSALPKVPREELEKALEQEKAKAPAPGTNPETEVLPNPEELAQPPAVPKVERHELEEALNKELAQTPPASANSPVTPKVERPELEEALNQELAKTPAQAPATQTPEAQVSTDLSQATKLTEKQRQQYLPGSVTAYPSAKGIFSVDPKGNALMFQEWEKDRAQAWAKGEIKNYDRTFPPKGQAAPSPVAQPGKPGKPSKSDPWGGDPTTDPTKVHPDAVKLYKALKDQDDKARSYKDDRLSDKLLSYTPEAQARIVQSYNTALRSLKNKASKGITKDLIDFANSGMRKETKKGLSGEAFGAALAQAQFGRSVLADPNVVGGRRITDTAVPPEALDKIGRSALQQYSFYSPDLRAATFANLAHELEQEREGSPRYQQLQKVYDGLYLASIAAGDDQRDRGGDDALREDPPEPLAHMIKQWADQGQNLSDFLDPNFFKVKGREKLRSHFKNLTDDDLIETVVPKGDELGNDFKAMLQDPNIPQWMHDHLRGLLTDLALDDMGAVHELVFGLKPQDEGTAAPPMKRPGPGTILDQIQPQKPAPGQVQTPVPAETPAKPSKAKQSQLEHEVRVQAKHSREFLEALRKFHECLKSSQDPQGCEKAKNDVRLANIAATLQALEEKTGGKLPMNDPAARRLYETLTRRDPKELEAVYQAAGAKT